MSSLSSFVIELAKLGVKLNVVEGALKVHAPKGALSPTLQTKIRENKHALITLLVNKNPHLPYPQQISKRAPSQVAPLSPVQQSYWFLHQLEEGQAATYNITAATKVSGAFNIHAFERSMQCIVDRHEALRTNFRTIDGELVQVISPRSLSIESIANIEGTDNTQRNSPQVRDSQAASTSQKKHSQKENEDTQIGKFVCATAQQAFDLEIDLLLRVRVLSLSSNEHIVAFAMHHIIGDGWSQSILLKELARFYGAIVSGEEPKSLIPDLPVQYGDYVHWQKVWLSGEEYDRQLGYWLKKLDQAPPILNLPTDRPRPAVQSYRGDACRYEFSADLKSQLDAFASRNGVTPFVILLSAYKVVLSRYARSTDIVVGTAVANRHLPVLEKLIGFFANTLVLRSDVSGDPSFYEVLSRVGNTVKEAFEHPDVPFDEVVKALNVPRDLGVPPVFQVMFRFLNVPKSDFAIDGASFEPLDLGNLTQTAKLDLNIEFFESDQRLYATVEYAVDLFDKHTIETQLKNFELLLKAALAAPNSKISQLPLISAEETQKIQQWNNTAKPYPDHECLYQLVENIAAAHPTKLAYVCGDKRLTYAELNCAANRVAHYLLQQGIGVNDAVGLSVGRSAAMAIGMLGIFKAGATYVPLDPNYPGERLRHMLDTTQPKLIITDQKQRAPLNQDVWPRIDIHAIASEMSHSPRFAENPAHPNGSAHVAYVLFTSGSTGRPKGIVVSHHALRNMAEAQAEFRLLSPENVVLQFASLSFSISIWGSFMAWLGGGTLVQVSDEESLPGPALFELIRRENINTVTWPVSLLASMPDVALPSLHTVISSAEPCPHDVVERWSKGRRFLNLYGNTEVAIGSTMYEALPGNHVHSIGKPFPNTVMLLLGEHRQMVPVGVVAEIYTGGKGLAREYLNKPEATKEKFIRTANLSIPCDRLYRTGDLGRYLPNGDIEFIGREDFQVNIRGYRVELAEIELCLREHPNIDDAAVSTQKDRQGNLHLLAFLVTKNQTQPADSELKTFLQDKLPQYMVPQLYITLEQLPLTPNRKVDRLHLPQVDIESYLQSNYQAPSSATETELVGLWSEVLGRDQVGVNDDFFQLGGHSLLATQVVSRIEATMRIALPLRKIFEYPTIARLAAYIDAQRSHTTSHLLPQKCPADFNQLSCAQERLWVIDRIDGDSLAYHMAGSFELHGGVSVDALQFALQHMCERHEILRTVFQEHDGVPVQHVLDEVHPSIGFINMSHLDEHERKAHVEAAMVEHAARPFNLAKDFLLRETLIKVGDQHHILMVSMHHIISDGWSLSVLMREFNHYYQAYTDASLAPLAPLPYQYRDFSYWQRKWLSDSEEAKRQLAYWQEKLMHLEPVNLPLDFPRSCSNKALGRRALFSFSKEDTQRIKALCQEQSVTPFMLLLTVYQALLACFSHQKNIATGSPIANRNSRDLESMIGFFVNMLVMQNSISPGASFSDVLTQVRETTLDAYANQDIPFELLVEQLNPERALDQTPLFRHAFILQNTPEHRIHLGDQLRMNELSPSAIYAKYDLTLCFTEVQGELQGEFEYDGGVFLAETIQRYIAYYCQAIDRVLAAPKLSIGALFSPSEFEQQQIARWSGMYGATPPLTIQAAFESVVQQYADSAALSMGDASYSYDRLNRLANQMAHYLNSLGVEPGMAVAVCLPRSVDFIVSVLAIIKINAYYVPVSQAFPAQRIQLICEENSVHYLIATGANAVGELITEAQLIDPMKIRQTLVEFPQENPQGYSDPEQCAYVMYTSGSTGEPKGIAVPHRGIIRLVKGADYADFSSDNTGLFFSSPSFDASTFEIYSTLLNGGHLVIAPESLTFSDLADLIQANKVNTLWLTAALFHAVVEDCPTIIRSIKQLLAGGDVLSPAAINKALSLNENLTIINGYGPTENTTFTCTHKITDAVDIRKSVAIGKPINNTKVYVLGEDFSPKPIGAIGELYAAGDGLALGYVNKPELTEQSFIASPFDSTETLYRTGDLVRFNDQGEIEFWGRNDSQIKIRGFRVELSEIESAIASIQGVRSNAVIALEKQDGTKHLVAFVVFDALDLTEESILKSLARAVPSYMVPSRCISVEVLPRTLNGKLDRKKLHTIYQENQAQGDVDQTPLTPAQRSIKNLWQTLLGVQDIGLNDNFFELGGDSILAIQCASRAQASGWDVRPRHIMQYQTIASLSAVVKPLPTHQSTATDKVITQSVLAPIQAWFFESEFQNPSCWSQCARLQLNADICLESLTHALGRLVDRHEQLRVRFKKQGASIEQCVSDVDARENIRHYDLDALHADDIPNYIDRRCEEAVHSINIENGPMLAIAIFHSKQSAKNVLYIAVHHLVVDGVSWRIILQDIEALYAQACQGQEAVATPRVATTYMQWASKLRDLSHEQAYSEDRTFWQKQNQRGLRLPKLPQTKTQRDSVANEATQTLCFIEADTACLLRELPKKEHVSFQALLLAPLLDSLLANDIDDQGLTIECESHGRSDTDSTTDVSQTVGWFTSKYPLHFKRSNTGQGAICLAEVQNTLDAVPDLGMSYGALRYMCEGNANDADTAINNTSTETNNAALDASQTWIDPEIRFNYLGNISTQFSDDGLFRGMESTPGIVRDDNQLRDVCLDINAMVENGKLHVRFSYGRYILGDDFIATLVANYQAYIHNLIARARTADRATLQLVASVNALTSPAPSPSSSPQRTPVFLLHAIEGDLRDCQRLAQTLGEKYEVHGLQASGVDGQGECGRVLSDMASHYIDKIRHIQREGPYYLIGHSMGGLLAFEMARQLKAVYRQAVARLIVLDVGPQEKNYLPPMSDSQLLLRLAFYFDIFLDNSGFEYLGSLSLSEGIDFLLQHSNSPSNPQSMSPKKSQSKALRSRMHTQASLFEAHYQAVQTYHASAYEGRVDIFTASGNQEHRLNNRDLANEWSELCSSVVAASSAGSHFSMLKPPNVVQLGEKIQLLLEESGEALSLV